MQKQSMFQSFMKKKQLISKMITESKSMGNRQQFKHFEAVSEPVYIKAESNAIYLTHLNGQFKDQLREFVHEQQSYNETIFQLAKITEHLQTQKSDLQKTYKPLRNQLNQVQLDKQVLSDKNNFHLDKLMTLQEQSKTLQLMGQEYQKTATQLEQDIEYEKCMLTQIQSKNNQIVQKLQIKSIQIEESTIKMQGTQKSIRQKESTIKKTNQQIKSIYFTLQAQDDALTNLCTSIEESLNKQNNHINDIEFVKNDLEHVLMETEKRKQQLKAAQQTEDKLLNYGQDLEFDLRRVTKQLQIEQKGIDEQYWKIKRQEQRLKQNHQMLLDLQQYLQNLIHKNQLLQQSLEQQIIQDHTIKKIVDSKCHQPIGKKTKMFLEEFEEKQFAETSTSWGKENTNTLSKQYRHVHNSNMNPKEKRLFVQTQVDRMTRKGPQQMEFVFEKFVNSSKQWKQHQREQQQANQWQNHHMSTTGFTYIDRLTKLQSEV